MKRVFDYFTQPLTKTQVLMIFVVALAAFSGLVIFNKFTYEDPVITFVRDSVSTKIDIYHEQPTAQHLARIVGENAKVVDLAEQGVVFDISIINCVPMSYTSSYIKVNVVLQSPATKAHQAYRYYYRIYSDNGAITGIRRISRPSDKDLDSPPPFTPVVS